MKQRIYFWLNYAIAICGLSAPVPVFAQIVPNATLPINSNVTTEGNTSTIAGGT